MYRIFNFYIQAKQFMDENPTAKLVGWDCGVLQPKYIVFIPNIVESR